MSMTVRKRLTAALTYLVLGVLFIFVIFPIFYTFMGSFKSNQELLTSGSTIVPQQFVLDNYKQAWSLANFEQYTFNSVYMSFFIVMGTIITSTTFDTNRRLMAKSRQMPRMNSKPESSTDAESVSKSGTMPPSPIAVR